MISMRFVHGNENIVDEEYEALWIALLRAAEFEKETCGGTLDAMQKVFELRKDGLLQYGTNYHYVVFRGDEIKELK